MKNIMIIAIALLGTIMRAELIVSYEQYNPQDLVIEAGRWKLTAQKFEKHGIKPMRVTVVNTGVSQELFTPSVQCITRNQMYTLLHKGLFLPVILSAILGPLVLIILLMTPLLHSKQEKVREIGQLTRQGDFNAILESAKLVEPYLNSHPCFSSCARVRSTISAMAICSILIAIFRQYKLNNNLYAFLDMNVLDEPLSIAPGQTVTKIVCILSHKG